MLEPRRMAEFLYAEEERFAEILQAKTNRDIIQQKKYLEESLQKAIARTDDVEMLYERLYEDNVKGKYPTAPLKGFL